MRVHARVVVQEVMMKVVVSTPNKPLILIIVTIALP